MSTNTDPLKKDFEYFKNNFVELLKTYEGKILVIVEQKIVNAFDTEAEAYFWAMKNYKPGTFLLQMCSKDILNSKSTFYSRVI